MNKKKGNPVLKIILNVITWTIFALLVLIALFLLYYAIAAQIYAKKGEKYEPAFSLYTIISGSMKPNINVYDVVVDGKVSNPEDIKVGDIITFTSSSSLTYGVTITHRVIAIDNSNGVYRYRTQGDNNLVPDDAYVEFGNILGKVLFKIPQLGRVQFLLLKAGSWLFVILIPSLGIVIYDILKVLKLAGTKKKIDNTLNNKKDDTISKEQQEKLKEDIIERLKQKENIKPIKKIDLNKVLSKIEELDKKDNINENISLPEIKKEDNQLPKVKPKKVTKTNKKRKKKSTKKK